jgi:hypothetical protein
MENRATPIGVGGPAILKVSLVKNEPRASHVPHIVVSEVNLKLPPVVDKN